MKLASRWLLAVIGLVTAVCTLLAIATGTGNAGGYAIFNIVVFLVLLVYFSPSFVAFQKDHSKSMKIFLVNLFLGWTILPWIVCVIWANSRDGE